MYPPRQLTAVLAWAATTMLAHAQQPTDHPAQGLPGLKTPKYLGCYSSSGSLVDQGTYTFQAMGWCQPLCVRQAKPILAFVNGTNCLCGDTAPPASAKVDDSECGIQCSGYPQQSCGGNNAFMVYNDMYVAGDSTGTIHINPPTATAQQDAAATSDGKTTMQASTVYITQSGHPVASTVGAAQAPTSSGGGTNTAAIAAGVVVAVVVVSALIGGLIWFMRRRKTQALDAERRRHEAMTSLVTNGEKPASSTFSLPDSRLEPSVMFQRRQSDGSIMDNQDYSRRILKVTNPDDDR